ncbi:hypothetical protein RRF57_012724 [Xylaria bambusicola]|uniref:CFEM domain-containing protein n=1 Tax=Xylaria bambusicola TaxID=326684 RepID=A0AAN7ZB09_9PEZI
MKGNLALIALAAGVSQVAATFGFHNAPSFSCPDNQDNHCTPDMTSGFDWSDLPFGGFGSYKGFDYKGYECSQKFGKRDELTGRSFQSKCITGKATQDRDSSPKISCDKSKGVEKTSIKWFQVTPEFDCDLEFHYTMPDGSNCKHRNHCKASGTTVQNTQCGGATDVTIVYPNQPEKGKDHCNYGIHQIGFDCEGPKPTTSKHHSYPVETPTYSVSTPASTPAESTPIETPGYSVSTPAESTPADTTPVESTPVESTPAESTPAESTPAESTPAESTPAESTPAESTPAETPGYSVSTPAESTPAESTPAESSPAESTPVSTPAESTPAESTPAESTPAESTPAESTPAESTPVGSSSTAAVSTPAETPGYSVTSYITTSTVFTTSVQTITSCGPEVPDCPAGSTAVTTVTIPVSTTVCPVTETISQPVETPIETGSSPASNPVSTPVASTPIGASSTSPASETSSTPAGPVETLPCPGVVPSCLNTWMFNVGCKDNTDSACYCPDSEFVNNVFACLYAHGESDEVISEAVSYFQGICAPFVPSNPGIATGAETITTVLTVTPTSIASVTTISVIATTVVPCTDEVGEIIPSSSSTVTISTAMTVPQVIFTTYPVSSGASSSSVAVVPGTYPVATPAPTSGVSVPYPTGSAGVTTFTTSASAGGVPVGTPATTSPIQTAGASRAGAGLGFLGMVVMAIAAL